MPHCFKTDWDLGRFSWLSPNLILVPNIMTLGVDKWGFLMSKFRKYTLAISTESWDSQMSMPAGMSNKGFDQWSIWYSGPSPGVSTHHLSSGGECWHLFCLSTPWAILQFFFLSDLIGSPGGKGQSHSPVETLAEVGGLRACSFSATTLTMYSSPGFRPVWLKDVTSLGSWAITPPSLF
jgi:hypothetical protein